MPGDRRVSTTPYWRAASARHAKVDFVRLEADKLAPREDRAECAATDLRVGVANSSRACNNFVLCGVAAAAPSGSEAYNFAVSLARQGQRPAASAAERKAHQRVAARFRSVGLRVGYERFQVPGKGQSRNVIGIRDSAADCLVIAMAHADTRAAVARGARQRVRGRDPGRARTQPRHGPGARVRCVAGRDRRGGAAVHEDARPPRGVRARHAAASDESAQGREARALAR